MEGEVLVSGRDSALSPSSSLPYFQISGLRSVFLCYHSLFDPFQSEVTHTLSPPPAPRSLMTLCHSDPGHFSPQLPIPQSPQECERYWPHLSSQDILLPSVTQLSPGFPPSSSLSPTHHLLTLPSRYIITIAPKEKTSSLILIISCFILSKASELIRPFHFLQSILRVLPK